MLSRIHQKLGTVGFVISIVALVAALSGGAYAASGGLSGAEKNLIKKESKKFSKQFSEQFAKEGPQGPQGIQGLPGAAGAAGKDGSNGTNGTDGSDGTNGTNGKNVQVGTATVGECLAGGAYVQVEGEAATRKAVCNGDPWTAGGVLPEGETETGTWGGFGPAAGLYLHPISFFLPLEAAPEAVFVKEPGVEQTAKCPGLVGGIPEAEPGKLCIYAGWLTGVEAGSFSSGVNPTEEELEGDPAKSGFLVSINCNEECIAMGTWAVTAEVTP